MVAKRCCFNIGGDLCGEGSAFRNVNQLFSNIQDETHQPQIRFNQLGSFPTQGLMNCFLDIGILGRWVVLWILYGSI